LIDCWLGWVRHHQPQVVTILPTKTNHTTSYILHRTLQPTPPFPLTNQPNKNKNKNTHTQVFFTVKPDSGVSAKSFKADDKLYISSEKLLPLSRFTGGGGGGGRGGGRGESRGRF
jgi:hypothetical protein